MKRFSLFAVLAVAAFYVLAGCHAMQNKELDNPNRDDTKKMEQKGSGD